MTFFSIATSSHRYRRYARAAFGLGNAQIKADLLGVAVNRSIHFVRIFLAENTQRLFYKSCTVTGERVKSGKHFFNFTRKSERFTSFYCTFRSYSNKASLFPKKLLSLYASQGLAQGRARNKVIRGLTGVT